MRENSNVVLTRDGWIKRVGRLASVEGTRTREGDAVLAVVPGSTLDHVILFADDGTAYTMRINQVPASSGYGEPVAKFRGTPPFKGFTGNIGAMACYAGQSVGEVRGVQPAAEIVAELAEQAERLLKGTATATV